MITVKETSDWQRVVEACFEGDTELLSRYHICAPCTAKEAAHNTYHVFKSGQVHPDFTLYKLQLGTEVIGFFGVEMEARFLTTFCIRREYRKPEILEAFWEIINQYMADTFRTALYCRNQRAINFLKKNGAKEVATLQANGEAAVLLELSWDD
jgi:hypothetical protein